MNGGDIKKAAFNKAKQVAAAANNATNGNNGGKKRRKGTDLKPIITTEGVQSIEASPIVTNNPNNLRSVRSPGQSILKILSLTKFAVPSRQLPPCRIKKARPIDLRPPHLLARMAPRPRRKRRIPKTTARADIIQWPSERHTRTVDTLWSGNLGGAISPRYGCPGIPRMEGMWH